MNALHASILRLPIIPLLAAALGLSSLASAAPPDLTNGGVPGDSITFNMGATGARGWVYHIRENSSESRQIQIKSVATGSPAVGILAANDVILGASGTGTDPVDFTSDARKALADAINDAEARDPAILKLIRWRAGTTTTVDITLRTMGAYSATAPYNCPKSAKILTEGIAHLMGTNAQGQSVTPETSGAYSFGTLSLLASNNPADPSNAARITRARNEARALVPTPEVRAQMMADTRDGTGMITWERGHTLIVMAEYYLLTGDAQVLPGIEAYAVNIAKNCSLFGTMGHMFAEKSLDGSANGPMGGVYGPVNSAGMPCFLGMLLAKECGITHGALDPAIQRMSCFYSYYATRGAIPYGEHEAYWQSHDNNGKGGLGALCFTFQNDRVNEGKAFARMALSSAFERGEGHTGGYFNYTWAPLGAACGGDEAAASHFSRIRWMLDLNRRWDGGFEHDCLTGESSSGGPNWYDFRMSTAALLTYALPLRQIRVTGKNHDPARWLTSTEVTESAAVDGYVASSRTNAELIADLGNWSPMVQRGAGEQLATRTADTTLVNQLTALANDPNGSSRVGACIALGKLNSSTTANARAATLAALLTDPQNHVRFMAAEAMRYLPDSARISQLNAILTATATNAKPLNPFDAEDPLQFAHGRLAMLLFYSGGSPQGVISGSKINSPTVIDRNLLYPAIRAVAANPVGMARSCLQQTYANLTATDLNALAGTVVDSVRVRAPADKMFSTGVRKGGLEVLQKNNIAEGVPLCKIYAYNDMPGNLGFVDGLSSLHKYAGGSTTVTPDPDIIGFCQSLLGTSNADAAQAVLNAIAADPNPAPLTPFKSIQSATADAASINLPANQTTLRVTATDLAEGNSIFTWRKVRGAGNVTFTPNGTAAAKDSAIQFDNVPGNYLFEVKMSDSRGLTEVCRSVEVTLRNPDGTLPVNNPPVANPQTANAMPSSSKAITLTGSDPEGYALAYSIATQPANGQLIGTAPNVIYTPNLGYYGTDSITFQVMDSEGQTATATVTINITGAGVELYAYEGFDYASVNHEVNGRLAGRNGGLGWGGAWLDSPNSVPTNDFAFIYDSRGNPADLYGGTFGAGQPNWDGVIDNVPATGGYAGLSDWCDSGSANQGRMNSHRTLARSAGAMAAENGGVLWMSMVVRFPTLSFAGRPGLALTSGGYFNDRTEGFNTGTGIGIGNGYAWPTKDLNAVVWNQGNGTSLASARTEVRDINGPLDSLIVVKLTFGAIDTVTTWAFKENETISEALFDANALSASAAIDENTLNTLAFGMYTKDNAVDEIRIGNSFAAVIGVQNPATDTTPPTLRSITNNSGDAPVQVGLPVTYTLTFSEVMDPATINASDFENAGTAPISIQSVNQTQPGVIKVTVIPQTAGTLQLRIPQGAVLADFGGNPLNTSAAITDTAVITILMDGLYVYEGFDYAPVNHEVNGRLAGRNGGRGWGGAWLDSPNSVPTNDYAFVYDNRGNPLDLYGGTFGAGQPNWDGVFNNLPATAGYAGLSDWCDWSAANQGRLNSHRPLARSAGEMAAANGGVLWMSMVAHFPTLSFNGRPGLALTSGGYFNDRTQGFNTGTGIGIGNGYAWPTKDLNAVVWNQGDGTSIASARTEVRNLQSATQDSLIIVKLTFGAIDTVTTWAFMENETISEALFNAKALSASAAIDENTLNTLAFGMYHKDNAVDEIRIGNSFSAVIGVQPDTTPPTLVSIADDRGGAPVSQGQPVTYTFTFSEAMDAASISAADFNNAGSSAISISSVTQPQSHIVNVQVIPTTTGTLQLQIPQGALLTDLAAKPLNTNTGLTAGNFITVNLTMVNVPSLTGTTLAQAQTALATAGLASGTVSYRYHASAPANQVLAQNPFTGTSVPYGTPVDLNVSLGPPVAKTFAAQDIAVSGTVTNTYTATLTSDNTYQRIREVLSGTISQLEHKWRFEVPAAATVTFHVEAYHSANSEGDDFRFAYSTTGANGTYTDMLTVTKTADNNTIQSFTLPAGTSGTIHVRVFDTDRTAGRSNRDYLYVDMLYFETSVNAATVPNVTGLAQASAESAITAANLVVGNVTTANHATVPAGSVISQNPADGAIVPPSSPVSLVVSLGPVMTTVPSVTGLAQASAQSTITAANLVVGTVTTANHATVPAGDVISQNPAAGSSAAEGSPVNLVVSLGPPMSSVPNVTGLAQASAESAITAANLVVGTVTTEHHATVPAGSVISQDPIAGSSVIQGSAVNLAVSIGPVMATVPNVTGLAQASAQSAITAANLVVGTVTTEHHSTVPAGSVISQNPADGAIVPQSSAVSLVVSLGPVMTTVPNVTGLAQASAESTITAANLVVGIVTTEHHATVPAGDVISQDPTAGASAAQGSAVSLVVSLGPLNVANLALADIPVAGTVGGTFESTQTSDNVYQTLTEIESASNPVKNRDSFLEHKWEFNVTGGDAVTFCVEAHHSANNESDDFLFAYSTTGVNGTYQNMFMVTKTSDNNSRQIFVLPPATSGTVHVRVRDTNRSAGRRALDTLYIDEMYILCKTGSVTITAVPDAVTWASRFPGANLTDLSADLDGDGVNNGNERIWGLDPTSGASSNPIITPLDRTTGTFRYTRRDRALTGLTYSVWTSQDLLNWTEDLTSGQLPGVPDASGVLTEDVSLSPEFLANPSLFIQVRAAE